MSETTSITIHTDALATREEWIGTRETLLTQAKAITVVTVAADLEITGAVQTGISKHIKQLAQYRLAETRKIDEIKKAIMNTEKDLVKELSAELARIKQLNDAFATAQYKLEQERLEAARHAAAELAQKQAVAEAAQQAAFDAFGDDAIFAETIPEPVVVPVAVKAAPLANNKTVMRWSFNVIDPRDVPREFCTPDEVKIRAWMNMQVKLGNNPQMRGVQFNSKISVEGR